MKKNIYIFSGLGADERVFQYLNFSDYSYNTRFVKWIPVSSKDEKIEDYAKRIIAQIIHPSPILIGLSFGGIIAIEVAKQIQVEKLIIIASVKSSKELPLCYRLAGKLNLHKMLPIRVLKKSNAITNYFFSISTLSEKNMLKQILHDTDSSFFKWAINCIAGWKNITKIPNIKHIHGTKDRILPFSNIDSDYKIENGGHLIVLTHAKEIMNILENEFK